MNMQLVSIRSLDLKACGSYLDMDFWNEDCLILAKYLIFCSTFSKTSPVLPPLFLFLFQNSLEYLLDGLLELCFLFG